MSSDIVATGGSKQDRIEIRREKVKKCLRLGMTYTQIAQTLRVHKNTVVTDVKHVRGENRERAVNAEAYDEIGDHVASLEEAERLAMIDYHACRPGDAKRNSFLRTAMQARGEKIQLQQSVGVIPKVADNLNITGAMEIMKMPDDALERRLEEIKQAFRQSDDFEERMAKTIVEGN
jgi:DNA-binding CsgD family transcriptional regulator